MSKKRWKWAAVAALALALSGCASTGGVGGTGERCNPRLLDCSTPPPREKALDCGTAVVDEARAELINPLNRHREAAYRACEGLTHAQVDGMIWKATGELGEQENDDHNG
ncbi:hypothetical protein OOK58_43290 [Streptomyces sp. NBC_01728]|uniref:hypothetical protein n=1 Tax=unclassified Streptomyces TaxID=2593676 RepID=UPI0022528E1C|nr:MULTISPECIES: hypothetical protein [unclassified Streptomyces]MCX4458737.1 hypothetical protein [Streptomyces sp. NBC_01719]MCX4498094.1 hypothetical protein [Streptomyces sp. NBC_01728]